MDDIEFLQSVVKDNNAFVHTLMHFHFKGPNRVPFFNRYIDWAWKYFQIVTGIKNLPKPVCGVHARGGLILSFFPHHDLQQLPKTFVIFGPLKNRSISVVVTKIDAVSPLFIYPADPLVDTPSSADHNSGNMLFPTSASSESSGSQPRYPLRSHTKSSKIKPGRPGNISHITRYEDPPKVKVRPRPTKHPPKY